MSAIKLINSVPASISPGVEFRVFQGTNQIARIGVHSAGSASIPTTAEYTAQAFTTIGQFSLASNTVSFTESSATLLAQVFIESGYYDFQLVLGPGASPFAITCENTWSSSVKLRLSRPNTPIEIVTVVDEHNSVDISTAQQWMIYAIINGITTPNVTITDPNATVTVTPDNDDHGFALTVS